MKQLKKYSTVENKSEVNSYKHTIVNMVASLKKLNDKYCWVREN